MSLYSKEDIQCYRHQALELSRDKLDNSALSKCWKNATLTAHTHTKDVKKNNNIKLNAYLRKQSIYH